MNQSLPTPQSGTLSQSEKSAPACANTRGMATEEKRSSMTAAEYTAGTLSERAAEYFGFTDRPHTIRRLNNTSCLIVAEGYGGRTLLMHYEERPLGKRRNPTGSFIRLTDKSAAWLADRLTDEGTYDAR